MGLQMQELKIPQIGLGTFDLKEEPIFDALNIGYRLLDTAWQYGNEEEVGSAIKKFGKRENLIITTKLWTEDIRKGKIREEFEDSLKKLKLDYVDIYLIHWPAEGFEHAWEEMALLKEEGKVKSIGVSNFNRHHIERLKAVSGILPIMNQIESHPYFGNNENIEYCKSQGIRVQAWCPLGGSFGTLRNDEVILKLAEKYGRTASQIVLRWHIQRGVLIIPRSSKESRLRENMNIFDFQISQQDMDIINSLDIGRRMGADPDNFNF